MYKGARESEGEPGCGSDAAPGISGNALPLTCNPPSSLRPRLRSTSDLRFCLICHDALSLTRPGL